MRAHRPKPGPTDHSKTPAKPGGEVARPASGSGKTANSSAPSHDPKSHSALIQLARLLGSQFAREATSKGGSDG